jgi:hypothetical protein
MVSNGKGLTRGLPLGNSLFGYKVEKFRGKGFGKLEDMHAILRRRAVRETPLAREDAIAHFSEATSTFQELAFYPFNSIKLSR